MLIWADYRKLCSDQLTHIHTPELFANGCIASHPFWGIVHLSRFQSLVEYCSNSTVYTERHDVVTADAGELAVHFQTSIGKTNVTSHDAGSKAYHCSVYVHMLLEAKPWFDGLK